MKNKKRKNVSISKDSITPRKKCKVSHNSVDLKSRNKIESNCNANFEIIKLTDLDDNEDSDDDCQWEEVSELSYESEIDNLLLNGNGKCSDDDVNQGPEEDVVIDFKNPKQKIKSVENEINDLVTKSMLLSLFSRLLYINKICSDVNIYHLALSQLPIQFIDVDINNITLEELHELLCQINSKFNSISDYSENGMVRDIIIKGLEQRTTTSTWINLILLVIFRSMGFRCRLVSALFPYKDVRCKKLCEPTKYRPSTRGSHSKKKTNCATKKQPIRLPPQHSSFLMCTIEVFHEGSIRWVPMDIKNPNTFDNVAAIVENYPRFLYVIGVDNDGHVKDIAARYDFHWAESSRRLRLPRPIWERILLPFRPLIVKEDDRLEDDVIKSTIVSRGIPRTFAALKGHPFFVLKKHMLKYEVLYPSDVDPFDQFNEEDVYLRDNVKMAHTRETWLKGALVVKDGEVPCKRVKSMMSRIKEKSHGTDPSVDLFGPWQVEKYVPQKAENGIVPVNSHGNVDMFQPSMLPKGCIHIRLRGVDKVARQLGINYAAAMVGWSFVKGHRAVPIFDGWIVCKEHVKLLSDALQEWTRIDSEKRAAAREKIIVKRWETLTRRILIKERLRVQYNF